MLNLHLLERPAWVLLIQAVVMLVLTWAGTVSHSLEQMWFEKGG